MPREQRTNLKKGPIAAAPDLGTYKSEALKAVNVGAETREKSSGQALSEAMGVAQKIVTTFVKADVDKKAKITNIRQSATGSFNGRTAATQIINSAPKTKQDDAGNEVPTTAADRAEYYAISAEAALDKLRDANTVLHESYFRAYSSTLSQLIGAEHEKYIAVEQADADETKLDVGADLIISSMAAGKEGVELQEQVMNFYPSHINTRRKGELYVNQVAANILQKFQEDKTYDWKSAIDKYLRITTVDGVAYSTHPTYGKAIDSLESSLRAEAKAVYTLTKEAATEAKRVSQQTLLSMLIEGAPTPEILSWHEKNPAGYTTKGYKEQEMLIKTFHGKGFATVATPVHEARVVSRIVAGDYTQAELFANKHLFTEEEFKTTASFVRKYNEKLTVEKASVAKSIYKDYLSAGKYTVGRTAYNSLDFDAAGAQRKQRYIEIMSRELQSFFAGGQHWENLTSAQIRDWSKEATDLINSGKKATDLINSGKTVKTGGNTGGNTGGTPGVVDATLPKSWVTGK